MSYILFYKRDLKLGDPKTMQTKTFLLYIKPQCLQAYTQTQMSLLLMESSLPIYLKVYSLAECNVL